MAKPTRARKLITQLHLWLGLISGLVVFVIAITGAIYTFSDELKSFFHQDRLYIKPSKTPAYPLSKLQQIAETALKDKPVTRIEIFNEPDRTYIFRSQQINKEGLTYWDYYSNYQKVYINPYTGEVVKFENTKNDFFQIVLGLHMRMLFGEKIGHYVVGCSVLMFVVLLVSGLVLWYPRKWSSSTINKSFKIKWKAKSKRVNYDLHNVLGFYSSLILLVIALTGLVWVYEPVENSVRFIANGGKTIEKLKPASSDTTSGTNTSNLDFVFQTSQKRHPQAFLYLITLPAKPAGAITISSYLTDWNIYDRVSESYDRYSGQLIRSVPFNKLNRGDKLYQLNYDLHTGSILSLPGKIIAFLCSLICASLPITGFLIWLRRNESSKKLHRNPQ